jgi:hypothetical protein
MMLQRARQWLLDRKDDNLLEERAARFAAADLLVVSYTKSGRTWLRVLLSNMLARCYGLDDKELLNGDNLHRMDARAPKVFFAADTRLPYPELGPARVTVQPHQRVLFLVRDPRDVAVSFHFHIKHRANQRELRRKRISPAVREFDLDRFVVDPSFGIMRVIGYLNRWVEQRAALPHAEVLRYEDLRADTAKELARVATFIGLDVDPPLINAVVDFADFESLKKKERDGYFNSDRLGLRKADNEASGKVRQGEVGGYRARLQPATVAELDRLVATHLHPAYGYR